MEASSLGAAFSTKNGFSFSENRSILKASGDGGEKEPVSGSIRMNTDRG
jgi:hypothetical protein